MQKWIRDGNAKGTSYADPAVRVNSPSLDPLTPGPSPKPGEGNNRFEQFLRP